VVGGPTTARLPPSDTWIGEPRTRSAVALALELDGSSHNVVLRGTPGAGRRTLLWQCLADLTTPSPPLRDHVYVRRFDDPLRPALLTFDASAGRAWVDALERFADGLDSLAGLTRAAALPRVRQGLADVRTMATTSPARKHVQALRAQVLSDLPRLRDADPEHAEERQRCVDHYRAALVREVHDTSARPVVELTRVDRRTLLGTVDPPAGEEDPGPDALVAGALVRADGGVCVVPADLLVADKALLAEFLHTLRRGTVVLSAVPGSGPGTLEDCRPDPIPVQTRIVVVGTRGPELAPLLTQDARQVFGVVTDCFPSTPWSDEVGAAIARRVAHECRARDLRAVQADAVALLLEQQVRDVEGRTQISCVLSNLLDRLVEADRLARHAGHRTIRRADVHEALLQRRWRGARAEERHRERLSRRRLRVHTEGERIGTVNALLVYTVDGHRYGAPARVTATTAVGREGVINIEREAKLSGKTFDKGVFELAGLLRSRFCQRDPLGVAAALTFEQSYGRIDGDSAAAAEAAAILSDLARAPVDQGLALTGSLSQRGELQSVGGVNEKIEGFWRTCRDRGPVSDQGVIIPTANVEDLVLDEEVVADVERGAFAVYAVDTIDEALTLLTGEEVGCPDGDGIYPADSLMGRAQARLEQLSRRLFPPRKMPGRPRPAKDAGKAKGRPKGRPKGKPKGKPKVKG